MAAAGIQILRLHGERPSPAHRLAGIHKKIHQHMVHLPPVHMDRPEPLFELFQNGDVPSRPAEHGGCLLDDLVQVGGLDLVPSLPGETQQLFRQVGAAGNLLLDLLQPPVMGMSVLHAQQHQRCLPLDTHQQVVEFMGDPSRQRSDGLQPLGLPQLFFQADLLSLRPLSLADVAGHRENADRPAVPVPDEAETHLKPYRRAVLPVLFELQDADSARIGSPVRFPGHLLFKDTHADLEGFGGHDPIQGLLHGFLRGVPAEPEDGGADVGMAKIHIVE